MQIKEEEMTLRLERCKRTDPRYVAIRKRHYVKSAGTIGRQLHYIVWHKGLVAGIISGASSAFSVKSRDEFFGLDLVVRFDHFYEGEHEGMKPMREEMLGTIINNTVFRLERREPNLATQVLALWRHQVVEDWYALYGEDVLGFETFIVRNEHRFGTCYKADNWKEVGVTTTGKLIMCKRDKRFAEQWTGNTQCWLPWEVAELLQEMYEGAQ